MIYYKKPLHLQAVFKSLGYKKGSFQVTESIAKKDIFHTHASILK